MNQNIKKLSIKLVLVRCLWGNVYCQHHGIGIEALGMSLPFNSSNPAVSDGNLKEQECVKAGEALRLLLEKDIKPTDIVTRKALENAIRLVTVLGGSTNAVLHFLAIAKAAKVPFTLDDFQHISDTTPLLADLKPSGRYAMEDLHKVGGYSCSFKIYITTWDASMVIASL